MKTEFLDYDARPSFPKLGEPFFICCHCGRGYKGNPRFYLLFRSQEKYTIIRDAEKDGFFPFMISKDSINEIQKEEREYLPIGSTCVKKVKKEFVFEEKQEMEDNKAL